MIVFPLSRSVGLRAAIEARDVADVLSDSRVPHSLDDLLSWARSDSTTKSTVQAAAGRVGRNARRSPVFLRPRISADRFWMFPPMTSNTRSTRRRLRARRCRGSTNCRAEVERLDGRRRARSDDVGAGSRPSGVTMTRLCRPRRARGVCPPGGGRANSPSHAVRPSGRLATLSTHRPTARRRVEVAASIATYSAQGAVGRCQILARPNPAVPPTVPSAVSRQRRPRRPIRRALDRRRSGVTARLLIGDRSRSRATPAQSGRIPTMNLNEPLRLSFTAPGGPGRSAIPAVPQPVRHHDRFHGNRLRLLSLWWLTAERG